MSVPSDLFPDAGEDRPPRASYARKGRVGIIDIGSNSVRFVVFDSLSRSAQTFHNEKAICGIGRDLGSTGQLNKDGVEMALEALSRYRLLADRLGVAIREAVATAAARDALNGSEFVRKAQAAWGGPIKVLTGLEEAKLAGEGVLAAIPGADGLTADLGGGSLDMVVLDKGRTGEAYSLPFGPLRLQDLSKGDLERTRQLVDGELRKWPALGALEGRTLYLVGGIWRSIARIDMLRQQYPLHMLQHYTIPSGRAQELCTLLSKQGRKSLEHLAVVSKRRVELLPYGAIVLQRLLAAAPFKEIVVSANGVREGVIFSKLPPRERLKDPLLDYAAQENIRLARAPAHAEELFAWTAGLFADETPQHLRLRQAACLLSDLGWRRHPDHRAAGTYEDVLNMPFGGVDHKGRTFIATAVFHRYAGDGEMPDALRLKGVLDRVEERRAKRIGLAARLGFDLSASATGDLAQYNLRLTPSKVVLEVPSRRSAIADETVSKRLGALAAGFDRCAEIQIIGG